MQGGACTPAVVDGRAKDAAIHPEPLCRAICVGLIRELRRKDQQLRTPMTVKHTDRIRDEEMETRDGKKKRGVEHIEDGELDRPSMG